MHWSEVIAKKIIDRNPNKEEYVCAAGISPSGSIHIGNFRDVATSYFVVKALRKMGKKARLLFSWDEYDRLRKVPVNVAKAKDGMDKYIGYPYVDVENPFDDRPECKNYAEYFEAEFTESIDKFGIDMDYRHQAEMYRSGKYAEKVIFALQKRKEIFDIIDSFRTQEAQEGERDAYYPVTIYCPECHRDTTKILSLNEETMVCEYECKCGHKGTFDFHKDFDCKLAWKVDWPMRWMYEGVDFEPGGKDHADVGGSYYTSSVIAKKIFGFEPPVFQGYEFIGIKGLTGKMSGSSGLNLTPATLLQLYQPEIILWLYSKTDPTKAFDFCFDDGILRQYFEFDKMYNEYINGTDNEVINGIMYNAAIDGRKLETVPMGLVVQLGSVVDFNPEMLETVFEKIGTPYTREQFADRISRAQYWLEHCSPENMNKLRTTRNWDVYEALDENEKKAIEMLHDYIAKGGYTLDELNSEIYAIPKRIYGEDLEQKQLKTIQGAFFKNVYKLIINKEKGPRLYLFLYSINAEDYIKLLDFSYPKTEEELNPVVEETIEEENKPKRKITDEPDIVEPVKEEIDIDEFSKVDLRVCLVKKCTEIRKSHNCLKLVLDDGSGEDRIIVSSIKEEYSTEELVGKKIIVVANLKPARFSGVQSNGMLLAATNNSCGCNVIIVDDSVPVGTSVR